MSKELQNKLYHYEVQPPAKAWEAIAAALDESLLNNEFPSTLYNSEATPPSTTWDKISAALDEKTVEQPVERSRRRVVPLLRYAAAAVIAGILFFSGIKLFRNNGSKIQSVETTTPFAKIDTPVIENNTTTATNNNTIVTEPVVPIAASTPVVKKRGNSSSAMAAINIKNRSRNNRLLVGTSNPVKELVEQITKPGRHESGITAAIALRETPTSQMSRYITLMTSDGNIIRMSNKLSDLVCCVSGEDQDKDCKYQLNKWRAKIASSTAIASPGNFMDILNMVNCLQEN